MSEQPNFLSKEEIANSNELKEVVVEVPEWGGHILIRELSGLERDHYESGAIDLTTGQADQEKMREMKARLVWLSIIDPKTKRRMFDSEKDFIQYVARFKANALGRIAGKCFVLNGLDQRYKEIAAKKSAAESGNDSKQT